MISATVENKADVYPNGGMNGNLFLIWLQHFVNMHIQHSGRAL
jgi:hypothetical protein